MAKYAAAIDQGTTGTRFMVFSHEGTVVTAGPGDEVRLTGVSSIDCKVSLVTTTTTIVCFYVNKQGVRPGSFSFGISDTTISTSGAMKCITGTRTNGKVAR